MSQINSLAGLYPGMGTEVYEYEAAITWGPFERLWTGAAIASGAVDSGNTPTTTLRMGLVMGKIGTGANAGQWTNYSASATDGSNVAQGVLMFSLRMADVITGVVQPRFYAIMISGGVKAANLIGLDNLARQDMRGRFVFDDDFPGRFWYPWKTMATKTANYQILAGDNQTLFDNTGAGAEVDLTLPPIANGYVFGLRCVVAQVFKFISTEGGNIIGTSLVHNNASVTAVGGGLMIYSDLGGAKWIVQDISSYNQVVTFSP